MKSIILLSSSIEEELETSGPDSWVSIGWVLREPLGCEGKEEN